MKDRITGWLKDESGIILLVIMLGSLYVTNISGAMWVDETYYADSAYKLVTLQDTHVGANRPPLLYYFIGFSQLALGRSSFAARLPIVVFSTLSLYLIYKVCSNLENKVAGLFCSGFIGLTMLFAQLGTQVMHDVPMLFFLLLLFYMNNMKNRKSLSFIYGIVLAFSVIMKESGMFWALPILVHRMWKDGVRIRFPKPDRIIFLFLVLGIFLGYFSHFSLSSNLNNVMGFDREYLVSTLPSPLGFIAFNMDSPQVLATFLVCGAVLGSILWLIYSISMKNEVLLHIVSGFSITFLLIYLPFLADLPYIFVRPFVMDTLYSSKVATEQTGLIHSYLVWIFETGGLSYAALLVLSSIRWGRGEFNRLLVLLVLFPLLILSLMSLKGARYMLASLVFLNIVLITDSFKVVKGLTKKKWIGCAAVGTILLIPTSPIYAILSNPNFGVDSGFDIAAERIMLMNPNVVASWWEYALGYYLGDAEVEVIKFWDGVVLDQAYERLVVGDIDLVLMPEGMDSSYPDSRFLQYLYGNYVSMEQIDNHNLYIYSMK